MNARETALLLLDEIEAGGAYANIALSKGLRESGLAVRDKALVKELVYGVIKNKEYLDFTITKLSSLKFNKLSKWVVNILRLGIYQIAFLDKVPQSAAVNESVKLAKKYSHNASAGFVNAVLRNVCRNGLPKTDDLAVIYSYPSWIVDLFIKEYGRAMAVELLKAGNETPPVTVRINTLNEKVLGENFKHLFENMYELNLFGSIEEMDEFKDGLITVQDTAFYHVSKALEPKPGQRVLDACAAPGGKTTHIAELMENKGEIFAFDIHEHKLGLINDTAKRLGIDIIKPVLQDATIERTELLNSCDRVLVDAPCSGLGIIRRKPDIKWKRKKSDIEDLSKLQLEMLNNCSKYLKKDGIMVYSTCTYGKEENDLVVQAFLEQNTNFKLLEPCKQLFPHIDNTDGAFFSRLTRC